METILAHYIDQTLLKAYAGQRDIELLCQEAIENQFHAICVSGCHVHKCHHLIHSSPRPIKLAAVAGFPLGNATTETKYHEVHHLLSLGADEIDLVINIGWLKDGEYEKCIRELKKIRSISGEFILKLIVETCYLTEQEKILACKLCIDTGMDYIKTSTGFGTGGATVEDVALFKQELNGKVKIKASGGISEKETAWKMIHAGADRIGTSHGMKMIS